ncbi:MAG: hypothetical protein ACJAXR_001241 [Halopseudomonas sp.]|jgi:hypothetical protein|uniref:hypothetical protein n=1 Tax=Halopseudomonas sp. TaxID=2901191 RepID=UPI0039E44F1F
MEMGGRFEKSGTVQQRMLMVIGIVFLILLSWTGVIDRYSVAYVDGALLQTSVAFAVARSLNAVISVLQSIDVQMVVVGFSPGEALDPFNDMVEQFGTLMQFALGSLILQKILLVLVSDLFFRVLLTVVGLLLIGSLFTSHSRLIAVSLKMFVFMVFLRFSVVLMVVLSGWVDQVFLEEQLRRDVTVLERLPVSIDVMNQQTNGGVPSLDAMHDSGLAQLAAKDAEVQSALGSIESTLGDLVQEKQSADVSLGVLESTLSASERYNFLNRSAAHRVAITRVDSVEARIADLKSQIQALKLSMGRIDQEREALAQAKGEKGGFWNTLGSGISSMAVKVTRLGDPSTYSELMDILNNMATTIVTVMTLFVLKTMILPISFLYLFLQVFKAIWGIDLRIHQRIPVKPMTAGKD